ncbi:GNAT family N-acetyltransferase [Schnuerera sp.]|uniref:GNAT family N-acetyltransferase n=1 Tax=Schnuerera sp. TaxID=2794844 RepID=UPI002C403406|nr:GNAT family N-acetyltransferase [Schnuerera sp.]HSH35594.1 GNAT family N-acetyltransferase [Schnuerera sp.]
MHLEEVWALPKKVVDNIDGDFNSLKVYLVQDYDHEILKRMVSFGLNIFGELGMDEWGLVPQIRHGNVYLLKEQNKKRIIGLAIFMRDWEDLDKCYLYDYAIAEEFHGQGLGYHFLITVIKSIKEQGFKTVSLTVDSNNKPAVKLYKDKVGFEIEEFSKDEYGKGHDRYRMSLDLDKID